MENKVFRKLLNTENDYILTLARLVLGVVFFAHGAQKMLGWFGGYGFEATMTGFMHEGIPAIFAFLAICAEFFGSIGLVSGFLTRIAAFGIACVMSVAITMHIHNGFFMNWTGSQKGEGIEYHLLALAVSVLLMARGAGALSLDHMLGRQPQEHKAHRRELVFNR